MPLEAQHQFITAHARTVIHYAYCPLAALLQFDFHPLRTCVQAVLHQFLDHRRRPFDHLAGSDLVNQVVWEWFNGHFKMFFLITETYPLRTQKTWKRAVYPLRTLKALKRAFCDGSS